MRSSPSPTWPHSSGPTRTTTSTDHPAWEKLTEANAHTFDPPEDHQYDLVGVQELVAEKPTEETVTALHGTLAIVSSIGSVCELPAVTKFFNGNPVLGSLGGGIDAFAGRPGRKRWAEIEAVIGRGWDNVVDAIDEIITIPDVDEAAVGEGRGRTGRARARARGRRRRRTKTRPTRPTDVVIDDVVDTDDEADALATAAEDRVLGSDEDFWHRVGIDPVRMMTSGGTFFTLRCYLDDQPIFLGRNGRVSVFGSGGALARYLADEHDHDLSDLATYDDIRTAATDGSLQIDVSDDNVYVLTGIADDLADGPDALDRDQLELAVELLRDVGDYAEDTTVDETLDADQPLGGLVAHVLDPDTVRRPTPPYAKAVEQWEALEAFVESRLRQE